MKPMEEDLDLSVQLYIMSSLMEVYYAQNYEKSYIDNLKADVKNYIDICMEQRKGIYSVLINYFRRCKSSGKNKEIPEEKARELDILYDEKKTKYNMICEKSHHVLETATREAVYYLQTEVDTCDVYNKAF